MLKLIYLSKAIRPLSEIDVEKLLKGAREKNAQMDISGALIYFDKTFIQWIEGPNDKINELFQSISHDARHYKISIVDVSEVTSRQFAQWKMKYIKPDACPDEVHSGHIRRISHAATR